MAQEEITGTEISEFPEASTIHGGDVVAGVQSGSNKKFSFATIFAWIKSKLSAADIFYDPETSGSSAENVQDALDDAFSGIRNKQSTITASGILKGDGQSGVSAAVAGTDYQAPLTAGTDYATPAMIPTVPSAYTSNPEMDGTASPGSSTAWAKGDHVHPSDTSKQDVLTFDNTPTAASTNPVKSGGVYDDVRTRVPKYGKGQNLLRNWYFVGGGTGRGVFPVNQRGQSSYTANGYRIDGWTSGTHSGTVTLNATGISIYSSPGGQTIIRQLLDLNDELDGKTCTMSVLTASGVFTGTGVLTISATSTNRIGFSVGTTGYVNVTTQTGTPILVDLRAISGSTIEYIAAKLELGTEQTLAHQENGVWVLNDVPDYEYELYRCITSTADPSDTYANKSLATRQDLTSIQATGTTNTTGAAIPAGAYFYLNGVLHRAKEQIGTNVPFTVNTNCVPANVMDSWANRHIVCYEGTAPTNTTAYRVAIPAISAEASILLGISLKHTNNMWYDQTRETTSFSMLPFINGSELRFTFTSTGATNYGGNPYKAYILTT